MSAAGNTPQSQAAQKAYDAAKANAQRSFNMGSQGMLEQEGGIQQMQAEGGEPTALKQAFGGARAGLTDAAVGASRSAFDQLQQGTGGSGAQGNVGATMAQPADMGASIARALYGSRITEGMGAIEERDKLMGMTLGQSQQAGSGGLSALGSQLGAIPTMQNYNSTYANLMGALNLGTSLYGAGNQAGLFAGGNGMVGGGLGSLFNPSGGAGMGNPYAGGGSTGSVGFEGT